MFGRKGDQFYSDRFVALKNYFEVVPKNMDVSNCDEFLTFFKLKYDPKEALRLQTFTSALQTMCANDNIDWQYSFDYAQRLGLDLNEVDLLKIVAVERVGRDAAWRVYDKVWEVSPGFIPYSVKSKMANSAQNKLYAAIGASIETGWTGVEQGFNKVADGLSDAMDKAIDPLKEMFNKVLQPCKDFIESKMAKKEAEKKEEESKDELEEALKNIKAERFPPLKDALEALKTSSAAETCRTTMSRVCDLDYTWRYTPYLQYPSGDEILEWFPPIADIIEKHQRLTVAMIDVVYVLGRGLCRAFEPLCEYVDKTVDNYDEKIHNDEINKAVWIGGKRLALDFFSLPSTTWYACWWCGDAVTQQVITFCKETVNLEADLLGSVANNWKPTNKSDSREKFAQALKDALDDFISDRTYVLISLIRDSSIQLVCDLFNEMFGDTITTIAGDLNDLVSKLPPPLSNLQPGDIICSIFQSLVTKGSTAAVKRWANKTERFIADTTVGEPESWKEELASKFRVKPRIRNDNDDNSKPEISEEDKKRNTKPGGNTDTTTTDTTTTTTDTTTTDTTDNGTTDTTTDDTS